MKVVAYISTKTSNEANLADDVPNVAGKRSVQQLIAYVTSKEVLINVN